MEKIAVISDIHGNMPALEAVFKDIDARGIKRVICLGDLAGKGPNPAEAVDGIRLHCESVVMGNWDYYMTHQTSEMLSWHQARLGQVRLDYMKELPVNTSLILSGKHIKLCHAAPNDFLFRTYIHTPREQRIHLFDADPKALDEPPIDVVGYGDIHSAHVDDSFDEKIIFNVGSVGNPLDMPQASYGILEGENGKGAASFAITIVRVPYDIERAVWDAEQAEDLPDASLYIRELRTAVYRGHFSD